MNGPQPANPEIPYRTAKVTFIQVQPGTTVLSNEVGMKKRWLTEEHRPYAAWNGTHRTDVFEVDLEVACAALA